MTTDSRNPHLDGLQRSNSWSSLTVRALYEDVVTPVRKPHSSRIADAGHKPLGKPPNSPPLTSPTSVLGVDTVISSPAKAFRNATASTKMAIRKVTKTLKRVAKSPTRKIDPFKSPYIPLDDGSINLTENRDTNQLSLALPDILVDSTLPGTELEHAEEDKPPSSKSLHSLSQPRRKPRKRRGGLAETDNLSEGTLDFDDSLFNDSLTLFRNKDSEGNNDSLPAVDDAPLTNDEMGNLDVSASFRSGHARDAEEVDALVDDGMDDGSLVLGINAVGKPTNNHISWDFSQLLAMENLLGDDIAKRQPSKNKLLKALRSVKKAARGSRNNKIDLNDSMRTDRGQFLDDDSYQQDFVIVSARESDPMNAHLESMEEAKGSPSRPSRHISMSEHRYREKTESPATEEQKDSPSRPRRHLSLSDHRYTVRNESTLVHESRPKRSSRRLSLSDVFERNELMTRLSHPEQNLGCNDCHGPYPEAAKNLGTDRSESPTKSSRTPRNASTPSRTITSSFTGKGAETNKSSSWEGLIQKETALGTPAPRHRGSALGRASVPSRHSPPKEKCDARCSPFEHQEVEGHHNALSSSPRPSSGKNSRRLHRKSNSLSLRHSSHPSIRRSPSPVSSPEPLVDESISSSATPRKLARNTRRLSRRLSIHPRNQCAHEERDSQEKSEGSIDPWPTTPDEEDEHDDIQSDMSVSSRPMPRRRSLEVFQW